MGRRRDRGTAIMRLASDSRTASPIASSSSRQGSPPAQELGGEMVLTGQREKRGREGAPGQHCRLQSRLPHCPLGHTEAGSTRGLPMSLRKSESGPGWDPGLLMPYRPRPVWLRPGAQPKPMLTKLSPNGLGPGATHQQEIQPRCYLGWEGDRTGLTDSVEVTSSY